MRRRLTARAAIIGVTTLTASMLTATLPVVGTVQAAPASVDGADPVAVAKRSAKETGQRVEIESLNDERTTTWANPDGTSLHSELASTPIRVRKNGAWMAVDTTLVEDGGVVRPKATKGTLALPNGGPSDLVAKHDAGTSVVRWPGTLPKPRLDGNTATYDNAVAPGADLVVTATATGFEQRIVLREPPKSPPVFRVLVSLPKSLHYDTEPSGRTRLLDARGERADLSYAAVLDTQATTGDGGHRSAAKVKVVENADGPVLAITPDSRFLANAAYPVTVAVPSDWVGLGLDEDTFVSSAQYPNSQASATWLRAGKSSNGAETWRTYIRFVVNGTVLDGAKILNADLRLWNYRSNDCGDAVGSGIVARRIASSWNPATITWSAQPSTTTTGQAANRAAYSDTCSWGVGELYHSVETIVQEWANGAPDHGLQLRAVSESDATNWRQYRSSEYTGTSGRGPVLFVDYEPTRQEDVLSYTGGDIEPGSITYDEAVASQVGTPEQESAVPVLSVEQARQIQATATQGYGPGEDSLRPDADEDWSEDLPDCGGPQAIECFPAWEGDVTPPVVTATDPADGATAVPVGARVSATFDEPVTGARIVVRGPTGEVVPGSTSSSADRTAATFVPSQPLAAASRHTVEISGAVDGAGNAMASSHGWAFTTAEHSGSDPVVITLPLRSDGWIDTIGTTEFDGGVLWSGAFEAGEFRSVERTYLRFDSSVLAGKTVLDAKLELQGFESYGCGTEESGIVARRVTDDWSETTLWWHDQPSATDDGRAVATDPGGCGNDPAEDTWSWQIDDLVRAWATGETNHGVVLHGVDETETTPLYDHAWQSSESGRGPVLTVTYVDQVLVAADVRASAVPAMRKFYQHVTFAECDAEANRTYVDLEMWNKEGWVKNSFSWCAKSFHTMTRWKMEWTLSGWRARKVGEASYVFTALIRTFVGGQVGRAHTAPADPAFRTVYAQSRITNVWKFNKPDWDDSITVQPGWNATGCDDTSASAPRRTLSQLASASTTVWDFTFHSDEAKAAGGDRLATCTLKPYAEARNLKLWPARVRAAFHGYEPVVRCDTSPSVRRHWGGCVLSRSLPRLVVSTRTSIRKSATSTSSMPNLPKDYAQHIHEVFTAPDTTEPPRSGKRFPGNGAPNEISTPLTRATDPAVATANRRVSIPRCEARWTVPERQGKDCDEYPPASSYEGAASPDWDYSVKPIPSRSNTSGGGRQVALWLRYRVLDTYPFKIWATTSDVLPDTYISGTG